MPRSTSAFLPRAHHWAEVLGALPLRDSVWANIAFVGMLRRCGWTARPRPLGDLGPRITARTSVVGGQRERVGSVGGCAGGRAGGRFGGRVGEHGGGHLWWSGNSVVQVGCNTGLLCPTTGVSNTCAAVDLNQTVGRLSVAGPSPFSGSVPRPSQDALWGDRAQRRA